MAPRIGSLCTGYGGLDMAVQTVFGGDLAWVSGIDPGARAIDTFQYKPKDAPDAEEPFHFTDWHEWNLRDHSEWFLIACHAVVWAITRYDQARTKTATTGQ